MKISAEIASCSDAGRVVFVCVSDIAQKQTKRKIAHEIVREKNSTLQKKDKKDSFYFTFFVSNFRSDTFSCSAFAAEAHWVVWWVCVHRRDAAARRVSGKRGECSGTSLCLSAALCCSLQAPGFTLTVVQKLGAVSRVFGVLAQLVSSLLLYMFDLDHFFSFLYCRKKKRQSHT